ncbi:glycosyltransferase [Rufibacter psychrotolerans]|uniref:glycosyltransferase n=1 Tax=Rufibacter psychrotolerans TaxID=2812556 RepID=UPI0021D40456|nr:glycosyltransferase [Rufibacter sp. SYSU D00308]
MENSIKISYILTTFNKLPYLKEVVSRLLSNIRDDEEFIVVDGGSKDGTREYLQDLYQQGLIHQFVSEPDKGEAHGFNKGMLMARGELVKVITDDDAFYYPVIRACKEYMLAHPEVDVMSAQTGLVNLEDLSSISLYDDCYANFMRWMETGQPGWFIGLPLLIRKKSLALTGLFHTGVVQVDTDFSLRITSFKVNIAWCTGLSAIRIENPQSNFRNLKQQNASQSEYIRMLFFYDKNIYGSLRKNLKYQTNLEEYIKKPLRPLKNLILKLTGHATPPEKRTFALNQVSDPKPSIENAFLASDRFFNEFNGSNELKFLTRNKA